MAMKEKSIDSSADGCLLMILPLALVIVFLFATWPVLLGILVFSVSFNSWQRYRWQQWSQQVNPIFHRVIKENQGRITPLDLAMKANFSAITAKRYLDSKAEEFGAQKQDYEDSGTIYYFITSSTLGSMLDESEPPKVIEPHDEKTQDVGQQPQVKLSFSSSPEVGERLKDESESTAQVITPADETASDRFIEPASSVPEVAQATLEQAESQSHIQLVPQSLIQSELAKRLNVYSSTVYKRRDDPDFSEWSRNRDPDGIAWKYSPETKEFHPVG